MYVILMKVKYALISKSTLNLKSSISVRYSYIKYLTRKNRNQRISNEQNDQNLTKNKKSSLLLVFVSC